MAEDYRNGSMDWDDMIENDGQEFIILPEGDYVFTVTDFERGRFPGGAKIPPCNKACLTLRVETDDGAAIIRTDLLLHSSVEWKLSAFFRCIGQKKHGERMRMDWGKVTGSVGRAHFKPRDYEDKNGHARQANDVDRFYDYDEKYFKEVKKKEDWAPTENFMNVPENVEDLPFD